MARDVNEETLYARISAHWDTFVVPCHSWGEFVDQMKADGQRMILDALPGNWDMLRVEMLIRFLRRYGYVGHLTAKKKWVPL